MYADSFSLKGKALRLRETALGPLLSFLLKMPSLKVKKMGPSWGWAIEQAGYKRGNGKNRGFYLGQGRGINTEGGC